MAVAIFVPIVLSVYHSQIAVAGSGCGVWVMMVALSAVVDTLRLFSQRSNPVMLGAFHGQSTKTRFSATGTLWQPLASV